MHGWTGKTITIDLSENRITPAASDISILRSFIGGRGLGVKLYYDAVKPDIDP